MVALRKGRCYRTVKRAYTRKSKYKKKGFIKSVPSLLIVKFDMGNVKKGFKCRTDLVSTQPIQIRQNALESARVVVQRRLVEKLGENYHMQVRAYPHHVLRENKMLTGAGADRMQTGMQLAFGRAIGLAAQIKKGKPIFSVYSDAADAGSVQSCLRYAIHRLPCKCAIIKQNL